jgi:hypothetical protein
MIHKVAHWHARSLRTLGYTCEVYQFSPDSSGWGVACNGILLHRVRDVEMVRRADNKQWAEFRRACALDGD